MHQAKKKKKKVRFDFSNHNNNKKISQSPPIQISRSWWFFISYSTVDVRDPSNNILILPLMLHFPRRIVDIVSCKSWKSSSIETIQIRECFGDLPVNTPTVRRELPPHWARKNGPLKTSFASRLNDVTHCALFRSAPSRVWAYFCCCQWLEAGVLLSNDPSVCV